MKLRKEVIFKMLFCQEETGQHGEGFTAAHSMIPVKVEFLRKVLVSLLLTINCIYTFHPLFSSRINFTMQIFKGNGTFQNVVFIKYI